MTDHHQRENADHQPTTSIYFAYGTLLGASHMTGKYTSARALGTATYPDHELSFWRFGDGIEDGGCTIVEAPGKSLIGMLYEVTDADTPQLLAMDDATGTWEQREIEVRNEAGDSVQAVTLRVGSFGGIWPPTQSYGDLVLEGAREAELPAAYQLRLHEIVRECRG